MFIIKHRIFFVSLSALFVLTGLTLVWMYGLNPGTDFKGGAIYEVEYVDTRPNIELVRSEVNKLNLGSVSVTPVGERGVLIKTKPITQTEKQAIALAITGQSSTTDATTTGSVIEKRFSSIGPAVGQELFKKGILAIALVMIVIILFIALAFSKVSYMVSSWKYGVVTIVALFHDIIIASGVAAYLGYFGTFEADALFLTALLTIMALSVNDTIVIFDRIRENLKSRSGRDFEETVGISMNQSFVRSINTSLTVILTLVALYLFGAESTKNFALIMAIGMFFGTYSSLFLASPLLVIWEKASKRG